jgi:hypothetical protein
MADSVHVHVCPQPYCLMSWAHRDMRCIWGKEHICDRCSFESGGADPTVTGHEWRLMHHLDIHTRQELEDFLRAQDPDFLAKWMVENDEQAAIERFQDMETELERMRLLLEDERMYDDENLKAHLEKLLKELRAIGGDELERIFQERELKRQFLESELEICDKELLRRQLARIEGRKANESQSETGIQAVEFMAQASEFSKVLKYLRPARARGRKARVDFVDMNVRAGEVEIVAPGVSFSVPVEIAREGYARAPYLVFEWFAKALGTLRQPSVVVRIADGQIKVGNLSFAHPDISIRLMGPRIADIPINAPLPEVIALLVKFRPEEIGDSGLMARVLAAQETASELIDRAVKALAPLEIERAALSEFIMEQIKKRFQEDK